MGHLTVAERARQGFDIDQLPIDDRNKIFDSLLTLQLAGKI